MRTCCELATCESTELPVEQEEGRGIVLWNVAMPQDWRSGCKSHRPKHMRLIRRELENIVVPADFVGERLAGDKVGACLRRSMFSLNQVS